MPILDANKHLYPKNWNDIRKSILERAKNACEFCSLPNYSVGYRQKDGIFIDCKPENAPPDTKIFKIVLTIAHVHDSNPANCAPENLRALCQKCHNTLDAKERAKRASETKRLKKMKIAVSDASNADLDLS